MAAPQVAAKAAVQREIENEVGRAAATKAAGAKAAGAKVAGTKMAATKVAGVTAQAGVTTQAGIAGNAGATAKAAGVSKGAASGLLTAAKGASIASWGPVALGVVAAALFYKYMKDKQVTADPSETDMEIQDAMS